MSTTGGASTPTSRVREGRREAFRVLGFKCHSLWGSGPDGSVCELFVFRIAFRLRALGFGWLTEFPGDSSG